jgi:DNA-binding NtrC family response regulator
VTEIRTLPSRMTGLPVRAVEVAVKRGPDAGRKIVARGASLTVGTAPGNDLVLADPKVSRYHLELSAVGDRIRVADKDSTNGTQIGPVHVRGAAVTVPPGTLVGVGDSSLHIADGGLVMLELHGDDSIAGLVGHSAVMRQLMARITKLASADVPILVLGESGTGKELVARALHDLGPRAEGPFVTVDCGALAPTLVASELFGHERGAFTGADRAHAGAFERAHGGTLFLDELGELPEPIQVALLGAIERARFRRVGGTKEIEVDLRFVTATNRDLRARVNAGTFRLDLYHRLAVVLLEIPPLRERAGDIVPLVEHFLAQAGRPMPAHALFNADDLARLERHAWPGNVRELRNVVSRALATGEPPRPDPVQQALAAATAHGDPVDALVDQPYREARRALLDHFEVRYLRALLERTGGNVRAAARMAEMDRSYLTELLRRHGLV